MLRPGRRAIKLLVLGGMLMVCTTSAAQPFRPGEPSTAGFYKLQFTSRAFDTAPFSGAASRRAYLLLGQSMEQYGSVSFWTEWRFTRAANDFGAEWVDLPVGKGLMQVNAGDYLLQPALQANTGFLARELYALQGGSLRYDLGRTQWSAFAGRAKRFREFFGEEESKQPVLFGARHLRKIGLNQLGVGITGMASPTYVEGREGNDLVGIVTGSYYHALSPTAGTLTEGHVNLNGSFAARLGSHFEFQYGQLSALLYVFDPRFPYLLPLYRPGESGAIVSGQVELDEFTTLFGYIDYVLATEVEARTDFRAELGVSRSFGSNLPHLFLSYSRNQIDFDYNLDPTQQAVPTRSVDLLAAAVTQHSLAQVISLRAELLREADRDRPYEVRGHFNYRRQFINRSTLTGLVTLQGRGGGTYLVNGEAAVERPLWRRYQYLLGLGLILSDNATRTTGEGRLRAGLTRRLLRNGLSMRLEVGLPFSIGLERSRGPGVRLSLDLGHWMSWNSIESLPNTFTFLPGLGDRNTGTLEGAVTFNGQGVGRVTVYVNGEARAVTDGEGRYRVRGLQAGPAVVRLDVREFEARYNVIGGPSRQVRVIPRSTQQIDFTLAEMSYLQGALLTCADGPMRPLADASLMLRSDAYSRTVRTSRVGGFQFGDVPPGLYDLVLLEEQEGAEEPVEARSWIIDLTEDVSGHLVRIDCEE